MAELSKNDLRDVVTEMRAGFQGVHSRLDILNGQVRENTIGRAEHQIRLGHVERAAAEASLTAQTAAQATNGARAGSWQRDAKLVSAGAAGATGAVLALLRALGLF